MMLGRELGTIYTKRELKELVNIHKLHVLKDGEANIMSGKLDTVFLYFE